ncbi:MAG: SdpI family protein [Pyrinomonadaceae bacterium]
MNVIIGIMILFALIGLLLIGLSFPLISGKVPPNPLYGFRTQKTFSDLKIWHEVNRIHGKDMLVSGVIVFVTSLALLLFGREANPNHVVITLIAVLSLSVAGMALHGLIVSSRR